MKGYDAWLTTDRIREDAEMRFDHEQEVHEGKECDCPTERDPDDIRDEQQDWEGFYDDTQ